MINLRDIEALSGPLGKSGYHLSGNTADYC